MDVHVPIAITEGLRRRGIDVLTSQEDGTREVDDETLLERASESGRILFSQDRDLLRIAKEWQNQDRSFAGVIFAHQQGLSIGLCVEELVLIAECCLTQEVADCVVYVPLR